jgi:hypothetical protein
MGVAKYKNIKAGQSYWLYWKLNPSYWNCDLQYLIKKGLVSKIAGRYCTKVEAHYTGRFYIVDCTTDKLGNTYPIEVENLRRVNDGQRWRNE